MKQKISYNSVLSGLAIAFIVVLIAIFVLCWVFINQPYDNVFFWILFGLCCVGVIWICCSIPGSVDADDDYVGEERPFRRRRYRYSEIKSAEIADADTYALEDKKMHFHGRYKSPVLITLKDGSKVIIGSSDPQALVDYINSKVS